MCSPQKGKMAKMGPQSGEWQTVSLKPKSN